MSGYKPRQQGRKDARQGKPRYMHQSAWNQAAYDDGFAEGTVERQKQEAAEAKKREDAAWAEFMKGVLSEH